jgi:hypothetical protein
VAENVPEYIIQGVEYVATIISHSTIYAWLAKSFFLIKQFRV